ILVASAVCHSRMVAISSIPARKNVFENPAFDAGAGAGAGVAVAVVGAGAPDRVSTIWFPLKLSEPLVTRVRASRSTKERPFIWITGTSPGWPLMMSVRFWFASCDTATPGTTRNNAASSRATDNFPGIEALLQFGSETVTQEKCTSLPQRR